MSTTQRSILRAALVAVFAAAPLARLAPAQDPDPGDYFEDDVSLGFKVRMPKGWDITPPQPNEGNLIAKYTPPYVKYINIGPDSVLWLEAYLIKFDRRPEAHPEAITEAEDGTVEIDFKKLKNYSEDLDKWLEREITYGRGFRVEEQKDHKIDKTEATEYVYKATTAQGGDEFNLYAMVYHLRPEVDVAVVFDGPADSRKWRKYEKGFKRMARSFRRIEVEELEYSGTREGDSAYRSKKRAELEREVATLRGWELYETPNYFIVANVDDRQFMEELQDRLEAIRAVYEELYPWDQADRIRATAKEAKRDNDGEGEEGEDEAGPTIRTTASNISPRELSRCSVVRVCAKQNEYHEYGGPGGSAGYWNSALEELVLFDDKEGGGRRDTWAVLNHEAFHQYIFYLYGSISPHSWYNEGHGDYFSGYEYKHKRFNLKPFDWRQRLIQQSVRDEKHVPLRDLVEFTQGEYYGQNKYGTTGGENYAQGWAFVYFLRTGPERSREWNPAWNDILDVYFETLAATGDKDEAIEKAFAGVDWQELEEAWKSYTLKG